MQKVNEKQIIRKQIIQERNRLSQKQVEQKSQSVFLRLISLLEYQNSNTIFTYVDCKNEVATKPIIRHALAHGKKVAVPKVNKKEMDFYYIQSLEELQPGNFGILEPVTNQVAKPESACFIMPGVVFDLKLHRIGYGGGYYDRYLSSFVGDSSVLALAFELQILPSIPYETFDISPSKLVTERRVITQE